MAQKGPSPGYPEMAISQSDMAMGHGLMNSTPLPSSSALPLNNKIKQQKGNDEMHIKNPLPSIMYNKLQLI